MTLPSEVNAQFVASAPYELISKSLRFRNSATAYLSRTFSNASTNNLRGTLSCWVKRGTIGSQGDIISCYNGSSSASTDLYFNTSDQLQFDFGFTAVNSLITTQVFRDPSSWYHIVLVVDTTQATASNRCLLYVNGTQVTAFSSATYPAQNTVFQIVSINANNRIGTNWNNSAAFLDGYMAEFNFIDGYAVPVGKFGQFDRNGVWSPIKYNGAYGTNGFYLPFTNTTSTTTLGYDFSANANNWTPNNFSLTAGFTYDSMLDVPPSATPSVAPAAQNVGNYAVLNPLNLGQNGGVAAVLSNGNLTATFSDTGYSTIYATLPVSYSNGTYGAEIYVNAIGAYSYGISIISGSYSVRSDGAIGPTVTFTTGDYIQVVYTTANSGTITFYKNGTQMYQATNAGDFAVPYISLQGVGAACSVNYGQQPWVYSTPLSGARGSNTTNLPTPTIANGAKYMAATLYTGNGTVAGQTQVITTTSSNSGNNPLGAAFTPDFIWVKSRSSGVEWHGLNDTVRGANNVMASNATNAEYTGGVSSQTNGFQVTYYSGGNAVSQNTNGNTYVGWNWLAGSGASSIPSGGTITPTGASINTTAGFSIITYTTPSSFTNATVPHGLGTTPSMVIVKSRSAVGAWPVWQSSIGSTQYLLLNTADPVATSANMFNGFNSTTFTIGTSGNWGGNVDFVAYCWAAIPGFSSFGSYTGNGSTDGPFIYTGFRPRWLMLRRIDGSTNWLILDTSRDTYNVMGNRLLPDLPSAETNDGPRLDMLSNGFKLRENTLGFNVSGSTQIYAAFAENPFKYSLAR